ncbi:MAG: glycosyltransferase family 2 protein [Patescibacteria group bacterium]|nr:glycosyltransferase family 2 protein [Patescibacteria group bacterium]MDD5294706.1 glycosyltransferase family 2 protein [Patescibacteria group bacterium]MDD5554212.1 glycosyltransferase family 2 protein [Patescibacteria group bacterium]
MKTFCVIPAYNEAETIAKIIGEVKPLVDEIVVVDDGSSDQTKELAKAGGVKVLSHFINRGQGAALETGNQYALKAGADIIVHFDADGQFLPKEIKDIISPILKKEADIVFGSRFLGKKSNLPPFKKYAIIPLAHLVNKIFTGSDLTDPQNGFRALSKKAAEKIKIEQDGMAHNTEIISKAFASGLRIKEIPVTVIYHNFGQRFSGGLKIIKDLILARLIN